MPCDLNEGRKVFAEYLSADPTRWRMDQAFAAALQWAFERGMDGLESAVQEEREACRQECIRVLEESNNIAAAVCAGRIERRSDHFRDATEMVPDVPETDFGNMQQSTPFSRLFGAIKDDE